MSRPLKIGLIISFVLWRSSPDLQFERISSRLSVVIMKASLACLDAVIDADVPVPQRFPDAFDLSLDALLDGAQDYPGGGAGESAFGTLLLNIYARKHLQKITLRSRATFLNDFVAEEWQ